jgi:hypothetical protein
MARKYVDCREVPSETNCTLGIAADSEESSSRLPCGTRWRCIPTRTRRSSGRIRQSIKDTEAAAV